MNKLNTPNYEVMDAVAADFLSYCVKNVLWAKIEH